MSAIIDKLQETERAIAGVVGDDRGNQVKSWLELLALVGLGGGGAGILGSRLGPSRSAQTVSELRTKIAQLEAALPPPTTGVDTIRI
jgi:hypothetical protein